MHETVLSGGRSPKQLNGPSSTQQLKSGSDTLQNSGTSFVTHIKEKRKDRGDQVTEPIKRVRTSKVDGGNSSGYKFDNSVIKFELSKIADKGSLKSIDSVEMLFRLMQADNSKKIDLTGRALFADVIAATDSIDCLNKFMQVGGVAVLDEWLQEAHKGKIGDCYTHKESDKAVEELLLSLLRALDKLPVNLHVLQSCNIGKSVNHLRGHKNSEIQKKARSLVDRWKKRVDAEMKMTDAKPAGNSQTVTWPVKPGFSEVSHGGNRHNGFGELSVKSTITQQSISKGSSGKCVHTDLHTDSVKSTTVIAGPGKLQSSSFASAGVVSKDSLSKDAVSSGTSVLPQMVVKEEKSSSSSQSHNNSPSCSSDLGKTIGSSLKEDARSSTAGSVSKRFGVSSSNRRSSNRFITSKSSVGQKESNSGKLGLRIRNTIGEKVSHAGIHSERTVDASSSEPASCHRLIVKLPNPGRSPTRSTSGGGSYEDPSAGSRTSSPGVLDKRDHGDCKVNGRNDAGRTHMVADVNAESWQSNDVKEGLGCEDGDRLSMIVPDEGQRDEAEKVKETFTSVAEPKMRDSFSSMNALIESCAKYSQSTTQLSGDDIGMNLLASVAAGETPKFNVLSPASSPKGSPATEDPCSGTNEAKTRVLSGDFASQNLCLSVANADSDSMKHAKDIVLKDEIQVVATNSRDLDTKGEFHSEDATRSMGDRKISELAADGSTECTSLVNSPVDQIKNSSSSPTDATKFTSDSGCKSLSRGNDCEVSASGREVENVVIRESSLCLHFNKDLHIDAVLTEQKSHSIAEAETEMVERKGDGVPALAVADNVPYLKNADLLNSKKSDGLDDQCLEQILRNGSATQSTNHNTPESSLRPGGMANGTQTTESKADHGDDYDQCPPIHGEAKVCANMCADDAETKKEVVSSVEISSFVMTSGQDAGGKLNFDLNEGIFGDDANQSEAVSTSVLDISPELRISSLSPIASLPAVNASPSPVTVAAPGKGSFMPPEILLRNKGDLGWKGSAATSAFRPAEPRKVLEMPLNSFDVHSFDSATAKPGRPPLDFDLNVADERALEDATSLNSAQTTGSASGIIIEYDVPSRAAGGLDFDLNRIYEGAEDGQFVESTGLHFEVQHLQSRPKTVGFPSGDASILTEFDLNNGPGIDNVGMEGLSRNQIAKKSNFMPFIPPNANIRMTNTEFGSGWFFNSYPAVTISSFLNNREQSYPIPAASGAPRILGPIGGAGAFGSGAYRAPVLSSSPSMAYSPAASAFSYAGFPFGTSFPPASSSFTAGATNNVDASSSSGCSYYAHIPSFVGGAGADSSPYTRPYVISHPEGIPATGSVSRKWGRQGVDLNTGLGCVEEVKDDRLPRPSSRQSHAASPQSFMDDQAKLFQVAGGVLKRKETDGGWETERFTFKHPSWQ